MVMRFVVLFVGLFLTFSPLHFLTYSNNDLLNQAYKEAKTYDYIINPGNDKDAVGGQVFNPSLEPNANLWQGCFRGTDQADDFKEKFCQESLGFDWNVQAGNGNGAWIWCHKPNWDYVNLRANWSYEAQMREYCETSLWWDRDISALILKEPYLIRLTKLILRITIALSVSIIIFAWIKYVIAFGEAADQKKAQNIALYALSWILIGLLSLALIELVLSITKSSLSF